MNSAATPVGFGNAASQVAPATVVPSGIIPLDELSIETVLFRDLGNQLPVGLVVNGEHHREVTFKPFSPQIEGEIGRLLSSDKDPYDSIAKSLSLVIEKIGSYSMEELATLAGNKNRPEWALDILNVEDVIALSFMARRNLMEERGEDGYELGIQMKCTARIPKLCNKKLSQLLDISEMEIGVVKNILTEPLSILVPLPDPLVFMEGTEHEERATYLRMRSITWRQMKDQQKKKASNELPMVQQLLSMCSMPETTVAFNHNSWEQLICSLPNKRAVYHAYSQIGFGGNLGDNPIGPQVSLPIVCGCQREESLDATIPWMALSSFLFDPTPKQ